MQIFMAAASLSLTSAHIHIIPRALALCVCSTVGKASPDLACSQGGMHTCMQAHAVTPQQASGGDTSMDCSSRKEEQLAGIGQLQHGYLDLLFATTDPF